MRDNEAKIQYNEHVRQRKRGNRHVYAAGPRDYPLEYPYEPPGWVKGLFTALRLARKRRR